jgi:hypothetical protein
MKAVQSTLLGLQGNSKAFPDKFLEEFPMARGLLLEGLTLKFKHTVGDPGPDVLAGPEQRMWPLWQPLLMGVGGILGLELVILLFCCCKVAFAFLKAAALRQSEKPDGGGRK